jgi:BASS family bile acid:Na+ symporter
MSHHDSALHRVLHALHRHFLLLVVASFVAAALAPSFGLWLWSATLIRTGPGESGRLLTLPSVLLALLLLNAGLGVRVAQLAGLFRRPLLLGLGFAANLLVPVAFVALLQAVATRCVPDACPALVAGFALLASMPVAASSTVWAQKSDSDTALSLGLVACSTCLSPVTTPAALALIDWVTGGAAGAALARLGGSGPYLAAFVMAPSAAGVFLRWVIGEGRMAGLKPWLQAGSLAVLLTLSYLNSSFVLPGLIAQPDWAFLGAVLAACAALCAFAFASGWAIAAAAGGRAGRAPLADVRPGHDEQRHRPRPGRLGPGQPARCAAAGHRVQAGAAPGGRHRRPPDPPGRAGPGPGASLAPADPPAPPPRGDRPVPHLTRP